MLCSDADIVADAKIVLLYMQGKGGRITTGRNSVEKFCNVRWCERHWKGRSDRVVWIVVDNEFRFFTAPRMLRYLCMDIKQSTDI